MSDVDVVEQLGMYGAWLEMHEAVELRPSGEPRPDDCVVSKQPGAETRRRSGSVLLAVAAIAVVVAGIAAVGYARGPGGQTVAAYTAEDPPGPIYVLPESGSGFTLTNGHVEGNEGPVDWPIEVVIVGTQADGTVRDLATVQLVDRTPEFGLDWVDTETPQGPARQAEVIDFVTAVTRQHGELWLVVTTGPNRLDEALEILDGSAVTEDGTIDLSSQLAALVIDRAVIDGSAEATSTYAEVDSEFADGQLIVVETATTPTPLIAPGALGVVLSETTVQGKPGWRLNRQDQDGDWNGITWQASPNRIIAVSGPAPIEDIIEIAETLRIVDEETWTIALQPTN